MCIAQCIYVCLCESVDTDGKTRELTYEDCCPRQRLEQHQVVYPTQSGMIPNYAGHLPGNILTYLLTLLPKLITTEYQYVLVNVYLHEYVLVNTYLQFIVNVLLGLNNRPNNHTLAL